jgi:hypothetical protein
MTVTNQNLIQEEIQRSISGNTCYHSVLNFCILVCCLKTLILEQKTIIMPAVLQGCETWYLTLRQEVRLRVFEMVQIRILWTEQRRSEKRVGNARGAA